MKNKNRIILLVVIGILLTASITVFMVTKNKTQAVEGKCKHTNTTAYKANKNEHGIICNDCNTIRFEAHTYKDGKCTVCGNTDPAICKHTNESIIKYSSERHFIECTDCRTFRYEAHTYNNGKCTVCENLDPTICKHTNVTVYSWVSTEHSIDCKDCHTILRWEAHTYKDGECTVCGVDAPSACKHTNKVIEAYSVEKHRVNCINCNSLIRYEAHTFADGKCTECGNPDPKVCEHTFTDGKCSKCGKVEAGKDPTPSTHTCTPSSEWIVDGNYHWHPCTYSGCTKQLSKGSHSSTNNSYIYTNETTHTKITSCECGWRVEEETEHTWIEDANCKCGAVAPSMDPTACNHLNGEVVHGTDNGGSHAWWCKDEKKYVGGTIDVHHFVNGVCKDVVYAVHNDVMDAVYECNYHCPHPSASISTQGKEDATCTTTGYTGNIYCNTCRQVVSYGTVIPTVAHNYQIDKTGATATEHWEKCTVCGAKGNPVSHTWSDGKCTDCGYTCEHIDGTHQNGGACQRCGDIYQTHTFSTTPTSYTDKTETTHTPEYKCTGCEETKKGDSVSHVYDKENDTKCVCGATKAIENPECDHNYQIDKEGATATEHWEKCTKCPARRTASHTWNDGKCTVCDYICKHTNTTICSWGQQTHGIKCEECNTTFDELHTYKDGKCIVCKSPDPTVCKHNYTPKRKYNTEKHSMVCRDCLTISYEAHTYKDGKCTGCEYECKHTNREWRTNETEHWNVCKDCGEEIPGTREIHTYTNVKCSKCGMTEPSSESGNEPGNEPGLEPGGESSNPYCKHINRETKSDNNEHWEVCKDCGKEIPGTREKHTFENGKCKSCGTKDSNSGKLPNTGIGTVMISIVAVSVLAVGGVIGVRKYKDI